MKTTYMSWSAMILLLSVMVSFSSCKKDEDESLNLSRMFMPGGEIKALSEESFVKLTWKAAAFTNSLDTTATYTVEVSQDSLFQEQAEFTAVTDTTGISITNEDIAVRRKYYARIKTNGKNSTAESNWLVSSSFTIRGTQLFLSATAIEESAILKWKKRSGLTKIVVSPKKGSAVEVPVSDNDTDSSDPATGSKRIDGLVGGTEYTAELFSGKISMGLLQFKTQAGINSANLVDLSGSTDPEILATKLKNKEIPAGATVLLARGMTYNIASEILLDRSVSIVSKSSFDVPAPVLYLTSNFNIQAKAEIDSIVFRNVYLKGSDASSKYTFNINNEAKIGKIVVEYCRAGNFRGFARLQNKKIALGAFFVNHSIFSDLGNYGIINVDGTDASVADISIVNSTVYKAEVIIVSKQNSNSVNISSSTFYSAPAEGRFLIDYNQKTNEVANGVNITDCIFGRGFMNKPVGGIKVSTTSAVTVKGSYATSDYKVSGSAIPNLISYAGTSADLFEDPEAGNFRIKDPVFSGAASSGDPRWR